jgi:2-polyprenyl-3-methyl-5-hydroxy-6-metoxy-1,4-benzoquinol methylase
MNFNLEINKKKTAIHNSGLKSMDTIKTNTLTLYLLEEAVAYHRWIFEKIRPWLGKSILEVGCGIGNITGLLLNHGRVIAADMNEDYLRIIKEKFRSHSNLKEVLLWDIQMKPPKELSSVIDTIVCSNVLEHVEDDDSVLKNFHQLLPVGGMLIVLVPAFKILYNTLDQELGHFRRYGKKELTRKLTMSGFKIRYLKFFNLLGILGWFVNGKLLRRQSLSPRQVRIFNNMVPFLIMVEKIIPLFVGQSLIAAGERK